MSEFQVLRGELPKTETYKSREWTWVAMPCRSELSDGSLTIVMTRGRKSETDRYSVQEMDGERFPGRVFLLEKLYEPESIPAEVKPGEDGPYMVCIADSGEHHTCTCKAGLTNKPCKHRDTILSVIDAGGLAPATEADLKAEAESVLADMPPAEPFPIREYERDLPECFRNLPPYQGNCPF